MYDDAAGEVFGAVGGQPAAAPHLRKGGDVVETELKESRYRLCFGGGRRRAGGEREHAVLAHPVRHRVVHENLPQDGDA